MIGCFTRRMPVTSSDTLIFYDFLFLRALDRTNTGTIFKIDTSGNYSLLFSFPSPQQDGSEPVGRLLLHSTGNIYGVTCCGGTNDYGVLFSLTPAGEQTVLHKITGGGGDGGAPP